MRKEKSNENSEGIIYIGGKPFANYITATQMQLEKNPTVVLKSRGKFISRVVDLAEVMKSRYDVSIDDIKIGSETFTKEEEGQESRDIRVSTIDVTITKKGE